ncbi:hypothetical protein O3M35_011978 [Rhynocoris fuscipes]|uniref:Nuclear pore complex protein n=1 Tax=Rhynocoris fuscipes TaxID=488301 RepID=A0AAW1CUB5_9HEMI
MSQDTLGNSLRLLDDALNIPPSSVFRWNKGKTLKFSTSSHISETTRLPHHVERDKHLKIRKSDIQDLSVTIFPDEELSLLDSSVTVTEALPFASIRILESLFKQFQSIYQTSGNTQYIFEAISSIIELITNTISTIWSGKDLTDKMDNSIKWLLDELNTWRLVHALYKDRTTLRADADAMEISHMIHHPSSEKEIVADFYYNDRSVREAQLVVDWLELCFRHENELTLQPSIAHYTDKTVAWENTLHHLNCGSSNFDVSSNIVASLDPDCVFREDGRTLHYLDNVNDNRLMKQMFREIRSGQLEKAQQLCIHCGQEWRAALLEGWRLFHDPNYSTDTIHSTIGELNSKRKCRTKREILPVEGNPNRDIWKICAWDMCEDPLTSPEERGVMGALCGHLPSLIPLCGTWEDQLWAYTKVSIDVAVEQQLRQVSLKNYRPLEDNYWSNLRSMEKIMKEISQKDEQPSRKLQELIILDKCDELINTCSSWLEDRKESSDPQFLRYMCHLVLILRAVGRPGPAYLSDRVICAYIKVLMKTGDSDLVAYYCSLLPEEEQIDLYSSFMERITDTKNRAECLAAAEKYDLNIPSITEKVVHNVRMRKNESEIETDATLVIDVTDDDREKISALDWMVYYPHQRAESIWECNALIRTFIAQGKISAARLAFNRIPSDSIELILQQYCKVDTEQVTVDRGSFPPKVDAAIKEYLCYKAYLDAQEGFSRWFHEFYNSKPKDPPKYDGNDFTEKVAHEHRLNRYKEEYNRWKSNMLHETKTIKALLFNIITFPDDGWLVDDYKEDETRQDNMRRLRGLCIPQVFMLLHKVLHSMELYEEAIDLVTLLMDESNRFYNIFNRTQLSDITMKIAESCDAILAITKDPLGWEGGDPIDMVDDQDAEDQDLIASSQDKQSQAQNIDTTLEEIPGVGDNDSILEEEELITAWAKMAESNLSRSHSMQSFKEQNNEDESDSDL